MPFKETCAVEERIAMFRDYDTGAFPVAALCRIYGVSRETFYVWRRRRESGDPRWFEDHSRAPERRPQTTPAEAIAAIVAMRRRFPRFGPKKIRAKLLAEQPGGGWPATSTIGDILKREGLIVAKPRRRRPWPQGDVVAGAVEPNGEWSIDFKGWFRTLNGIRCDPLTLEDTASRYLIAARIVEPTGAGVRRALERIFQDVGLPDTMRSDNGPPFGSMGAGGLSRLSVWWLKLGIEPRYITPSAPQENGRHERMHRTLKEDTTQPPAATISEQQTRFDAFRKRYNEERPHEALGQTPPATHWQPSARPFPSRLAEPWYDADHEVRRVRPTGEIKWRGERVFIGEALVGELVGLAELERGGHIVRFCRRELGVIGRDFRFHRFAPPRARLRFAVETEGE
jgi:transposase InsO family protein